MLYEVSHLATLSTSLLIFDLQAGGCLKLSWPPRTEPKQLHLWPLSFPCRLSLWGPLWPHTSSPLLPVRAPTWARLKHKAVPVCGVYCYRGTMRHPNKLYLNIRHYCSTKPLNDISTRDLTSWTLICSCRLPPPCLALLFFQLFPSCGTFYLYPKFQLTFSVHKFDFAFVFY